MTEPSTLAPQEVNRNFALGVTNGALFKVFFTLIDPSVVLTWFLSQLGAGAFVIGLLTPMQNVGWFLPQLLMSNYVQRQPRKMTVFRQFAVGRVVLWLAFVILVLALGDRNPGLLLTGFLVIYSSYWLMAGVSGPAFMDILGSSLPADRRGSLWAMRDFVGGILAIGAAALARYILDDARGWPFPLNFGILFAVATPFVVASLAVFSMIHEAPASVRTSGPMRFLDLASVRTILRQDRDLRLFLIARTSMLMTWTAVPFYTVFARDVLGAPSGVIGTYLGLMTAALLGSSLFWGRLCDRKGTRLVMLGVTLLMLPQPLIPLLMGARIPYTLFGVVYILQGVVQAGMEVFASNYILDLAPSQQRVIYISFSNTALGIVSLVLALAGVVAQVWGLTALFALCTLSALLAPALTWRLREPRVRSEAS